MKLHGGSRSLLRENSLVIYLLIIFFRTHLTRVGLLEARRWEEKEGSPRGNSSRGRSVDWATQAKAVEAAGFGQ